MTRDEAFRAWCTRNGTAQEALAYDIWCAAWEEATAIEREACAIECENLGIRGYGTLAAAAGIRARTT